ncbi:MAG: penicillin-binding protein 2, partial [Acidiferrobacterales bacterium]
AEAALKGRRGAAVALDPRNGEVLALVSTPVYDPNPFINGIDPEAYRLLLDDPDKPLINRAINGQYAPGSTIKPFLALAALELEDFNPEETVICHGAFRLPGSRRRFRDWKRFGHGEMNLHNAVVQSCDVYFYRLALTLGIRHIKDFLASLGFGTPTGIDIMGESPGLLPSPEWKKARGEAWYPGETVVTGIGQGPILATPLQLATAVSMFANRGKKLRPTLLRAIEDPKTGARQLAASESAGQLTLRQPGNWETVLASLTDVVHGERGTGRRIGWNAPYKIAGKTGTSQVKGLGQTEQYDEENTPLHLRDHALFIAFAPADDPQIAVAVVVENGGAGSAAAAPVARKMMDAYLLSQGKTPKRPPKPKLKQARP